MDTAPIYILDTLYLILYYFYYFTIFSYLLAMLYFLSLYGAIEELIYKGCALTMHL